MIIKLVKTNLKTKFGEFHEMLFYNSQKESFALVIGDVNEGEDL